MAGYCGCLWQDHGNRQPQYLPQVSLEAHATILSSVARTTLTQVFVNPSDRVIEEISYHFPLYDGVSVVGFECKVGSRLLHSRVKTKSQANTDYQNAVAQHQIAAVMDHTSMNDVFIIRLGNVPAHGKINVDITFVGELKQDSQTDGIRYTLPSTIAPRYGTGPFYNSTQLDSLRLPANPKGMSITVDVQMEKGLVIRELESPSHRVKVSLGRISSTTAPSSTFEPWQASASVITQQNNTSVVLEHDFVILIKADGLDTPCALLERHPTIPNQRALMATLVPKFSLQPANPEVVFVIDRSGSMGPKLPTLTSALKVFLKSLPVGICFNICSFGSYYSFMWPRSKVYDKLNSQQALAFVDTIDADMGGTEMQGAVMATVQKRLNFNDLDVLLLTDGKIYHQDRLFDFVREKAADNTVRFFSLGIGEAASHSLIEGIARAGNGFCQSVTEYEELDRKVVRMLKGALTPHIHDFELEVEYDTETEREFDFVSDTENLIDIETEGKKKEGDGDVSMKGTTGSLSQSILLYDENFQESDMNVDAEKRATETLPTLTPPGAIRAPYNVPPLYPFIRTNVFLLMDPHSPEKIPKSLKFTATSNNIPLELRIPICEIGTGETIHQLASRKAVIELEEGHGWLSDAEDEKGNKFKQFHADTKKRLAKRECQNLGIKFQVTGKYCSFVASEECSSSSERQDQQHTPKEHAAERVPPISQSARFLGGGPPHNGGGWGASLPMQALFQYTGPQQISNNGVAPFTLMGPGESNRMCRPRAVPAAPMNMMQPQARALMIQTEVSSPGNTEPTVPRPLYGSAASSAAPKLGAVLARSARVATPPTPTSTKTPQMRMHELIQLQTFEGSWSWSKELFDLLECNMKSTTRKLATMYHSLNRKVEKGFPQGDEATVLATLLAMGWLCKKQPAFKDVWELVHAKASDRVRIQLKKMRDRGSPAAIIASVQDEITDMV
ncbi:hypothetical protein ACN38_g6765 [Penicillium nordicum]|uniref:VIT domain-containing protein n=1 Tax=Penicillium nordicum TaxID=229535 RepID=A0A0M8P010_9EURO|nr:hypothetical protein ACN38_g6765 [Penicillium nordicum]